MVVHIQLNWKYCAGNDSNTVDEIGTASYRQYCWRHVDRLALPRRSDTGRVLRHPVLHSQTPSHSRLLAAPHRQLNIVIAVWSLPVEAWFNVSVVVDASAVVSGLPWCGVYDSIPV